MFDPNLLDDNLKSGATGLQVTDESKAYLLETAKWGKFLGILGYVGAGLMVLVGIFMLFTGGALGEAAGAGLGLIAGPLLGVLYLLIAAFYFFPARYLYQFSDKTKTAVARNDTPTLTEALSNLKSLYKFLGITTAVILGFYALVLLFAIIGGGIGAFL